MVGICGKWCVFTELPRYAMLTYIKNEYEQLEKNIDDLRHRFGIIKRCSSRHWPYFNLLEKALLPAMTLNEHSTKEEIVMAKKHIQAKKANLDEHLGDNGLYQRCKVATDDELSFCDKLCSISMLLDKLLKSLHRIESLFERGPKDEKKIEALKSYSYRRALKSNDYEHSIFSFSCFFFNFSKKEKVNVVSHLIKIIDGSSRDPLTDYEVRILNNGELGKLVKKLHIDPCKVSHSQSLQPCVSVGRIK
jgi:hypothetical protein